MKATTKKTIFVVYYIETGDIIGRYHSEAKAKKAIDRCNEISGTFGRLAYDLKYIY